MKMKMKSDAKVLFLIITFLLFELAVSIEECKVFSELSINGKNPIMEEAKKGNIVMVTIVSSKYPSLRKHTLFALNNFATYNSAVTKSSVKVMALNIQWKEPLSQKVRDETPFITIYDQPKERDYVKELGAGKWDVLIFDKCGRMTYHYMYPYSGFEYPFVSNAVDYTVRNYETICGYCDSGPATVKPVVIEHNTGFVPANIPKSISMPNDAEMKKKYVTTMEPLLTTRDVSSNDGPSDTNMKNGMWHLHMNRFHINGPQKDDSGVQEKYEDEETLTEVEGDRKESSSRGKKPWEMEEDKENERDNVLVKNEPFESNKVSSVDKDAGDSKKMSSLLTKVLEVEKKENNMMMDYLLKRMKPSAPQKDTGALYDDKAVRDESPLIKDEGKSSVKEAMTLEESNGDRMPIPEKDYLADEQGARRNEPSVANKDVWGGRNAQSDNEDKSIIKRVISMKKWENDLVLNYLLQRYAQ